MSETDNIITRRPPGIIDVLGASLFFGFVAGLLDTGMVLSSGFLFDHGIISVLQFLNASALLTSLAILPILLVVWLFVLVIGRVGKSSYETGLTAVYFIGAMLALGLLMVGKLKNIDDVYGLMPSETIGSLKYIWILIPFGWVLAPWLVREKTGWESGRLYAKLSAFVISISVYIVFSSYAQSKLLTSNSTLIEEIIIAAGPFVPAVICLIFLSRLLGLASKSRKGIVLTIILLVFFIVPFIPSIMFGPSTVGTTPSGAAFVGESKNVILISIDTCRKDDIGVYGSKVAKTPNIDAFAAESIVFDNAITPIPMTGPSHMTMLTGLQPDPSYGHGVLNNGNKLPSDIPTIATELDKLGFKTGAVIGGSPLSREASGLQRGFHYYNDVFKDDLTARIFPVETWSLTVSKIARKLFAVSGLDPGWLKKDAETVTGQAEDFIGQCGDDNFFLFVHYYDPHGPLNPPPPYDSMYPGDIASQEFPYKDTHPLKSDVPDELANKFDDAALAARRAMYRGEISYTDHWIGQLLEYLKQQGLYDDTLIIITADHGEAFENAFIGHLNRLYETCVNVPLIIRVPDFGVDRRYSLRGSNGWLVDTSDIYYTALNFLDVPVSEDVINQIHENVPGSTDSWKHDLLDWRLFIMTEGGPFPSTWDFIPLQTYGVPSSNETFVGPTYALRWQFSKLIYAPQENDLLPEYQLFHLDPLEEHEFPQSAWGSLEFGSELLESWAATTKSINAGSIDPLTREQLEALGYTQH